MIGEVDGVQRTKGKVRRWAGQFLLWCGYGVAVWVSIVSTFNIWSFKPVMSKKSYPRPGQCGIQDSHSLPSQFYLITHSLAPH